MYGSMGCAQGDIWQTGAAKCQKLHESQDRLPDSVLAYVEASRNRMSAFEHSTLEDVEEKDLSSQEHSHLNHKDNPTTKPASDFIEDPIKWKKKVISELEEQVGLLKDVEPRNAQQDIPNMSWMEDVSECDTLTEIELQLSLEWKELEKRLKEEEEQKLSAQEVERLLHLNLEREEEEMRKRRLMEFEEELRKMEEATQIQNPGVKNEVNHAEDLQLQMDKHQNLIRKLEGQIEEEKQAFEEAQEEERRRTQKLHCRAATKIQAALRGALARRWSKKELRRKREEEKRYEEEKREWEKMKKEKEEERKRIEEEERAQREEMERRRADYERAKEQDRHRLEREQRLEQQRRKEEEHKKRREMKRKEEQNNITQSVRDDCRRQEVDTHRKNKEKERTEVETSSQVENEFKREENKIKGNEAIVRKIEDNNAHAKNMKNTLDDDRDAMKKQDKPEGRSTEDTETLHDMKPQTKSDKDRIKSHEVMKKVELDSQINLSQSRKSFKLTESSPESHINAHQGLSNDLGISLIGSSSVEATPSVDTDLTKPTSDLNAVAPEMNTRGHQYTTDTELKDQESVSVCLPDSTERKRLAWMMSCTPWSKLSLQNKRKVSSAQQQSQKRVPRRKRVPSLPPLSVNAILKTGTWSSLKQVTTVMLEDLPGCSLSTLSECNNLQTLTLRRCGLTSLDGLNQCAQIRYVDVQENSITHVDCGGLVNLQVLLLGKNQLMNTHGFDGAENLQILQLSHNNISRISGLGPLKMLLRLSVDHNQLLSTRGLKEIYTLLHLDCSYNHLCHVEGLENCALLNTLDLRGNSLTELPVLQNHVLLRDLYLDDNLISSILDLGSYWLPLLQNLSVAQNSITRLIPFLDLVSLRTLDASNNCLSDLQNVCRNLQKCTSLQELNLTGCPLQQENNWRSLLLETVPGLIKLNNEQIAVAAASPNGPEQKWTFQAFCQAQQKQRDSLIQKQKMEISSTPSLHDAQLLAIGHQPDLFRLAVDQRYAHEYGDSCVTEDFALATAACGRSRRFSEASFSRGQSPETQPRHTADWQNSDLELRSADCTETQSEKECVQALNLKIEAAVVIQRRWRRRCVLRRREGLPGLIERTNTKSSLHKVEDTCIERPERERAAVVIQAVWRGCVLRKRLARALAAAQITESDEDFEEVDMEEFTFDEKMQEKDWITLHSYSSPARMMPFSEQLPLPKSQVLLPMPPKTLSVFPRQLKHAWSDSGDAACFEQCVSPHLSTRSVLKKHNMSEKSEKILNEWGITNDSTALLMLKRAKKMKGRKQQEKRLLDPNLRLALFRSHSSQFVSTETQRTRFASKDNFKAHKAANEVYKSLKAEEKQTYQWLQPDTDSTGTGREHFLPDIGHDILNGGRVQLVASGERDGVDSGEKFGADPTDVSPPLKKHSQTRRYSAENRKAEVPSPTRVNSAPIQKERISFRDNPVRRSGGWGGGKKRAKVNK
ncbi:leucine-rich repeat and IQ domain-containing protein 1 isoform X2 [Pimephales promelas]|uniref:leucine-rich repeat and IQ domain-containing protein 1 isoform X2 n=1 Tax=Pimephales promelas TaxID=90988 RepID=UPI0019557480|nr:leucine-rich repeat and IQ domain-containing protein 1 isoform X2 [Pimephales promelas]KAG1937079.1 leucine-rich repeat and IQ domain-containing protein [Pimephales promelas]